MNKQIFFKMVDTKKELREKAEKQWELMNEAVWVFDNETNKAMENDYTIVKKQIDELDQKLEQYRKNLSISELKNMKKEYEEMEGRC